MPDATRTYDYVIVGGGTAGCVIASRLSRNPDVTVALLEGGEAFEHDPMVLGYHGSVPLLGNPKYDYDYRIVPQTRGNSAIRHSRAKMLGGCSAHNDTVAFRPPDRDLQAWEEAGAHGWGPADTRLYYDRAMQAVNVHRALGENELAQATHAAAQEMGLPERDVHGAEFDEAAGWLYLNERDGVRQSTAVGYMYPLADLPANLTLATNTWAERLAINNDGRATGVVTNSGTWNAAQEVILCAGSIDTPKLLMLSGIGPADQLRESGITPIHDLPGVGQHLIDHLEIPIMWSTKRTVGHSLQSAENAFFCKSRPDLDHFDLFFHVILQPYFVPLSLNGSEYPAPDHGFCVCANVANPKSAGQLRLSPRSPAGPPLIDPAYLTDPGEEDLTATREAIRIARWFAAQPSLADWIDSEIAPGADVADDDEAQLDAFIRGSSNTVYHPAGTCRMGEPSDTQAVVDPELRVRGIDGLRVADASVFPKMISVNLCMTVIMIGERCADLLAR
jgi:choline oxidase